MWPRRRTRCGRRCCGARSTGRKPSCSRMSPAAQPAAGWRCYRSWTGTSGPSCCTGCGACPSYPPCYSASMRPSRLLSVHAVNGLACTRPHAPFRHQLIHAGNSLACTCLHALFWQQNACLDAPRCASKKGTTGEEYIRFWVYSLESASKIADDQGAFTAHAASFCPHAHAWGRPVVACMRRVYLQRACLMLEGIALGQVWARRWPSLTWRATATPPPSCPTSWCACAALQRAQP